MKITVIAHPNSKRPQPACRQAGIEKNLLETFHVYVNQPPLEGKANRAVIEALSQYFNVSNNKVIFVSGEKSKNKIFEIID